MRNTASSELEPVASREQKWLIEFRQGDITSRDAAFEALFRVYQRGVRGWILRIVRDSAAADDLTLETFWRIYRAHARFEPERGFEPWARRIATHTAIDWLRTKKPEYAMDATFFNDLSSPAAKDAAVSAEIRQKIALAFGRLRPGLRVAAILAVIEERPYKEVAEALGISVMAVKSRVFRALRLLRKDLQQQGITP